MFAAQGFTCIEADLVPPDLPSDSMRMMAQFEAELDGHIRLAAIPFPPVIFARDAAALIAQTYISSHPATGLFLVDPPPSNQSVQNLPNKHLLPTVLPEFDFEPTFPIALMARKDEMGLLLRKSRLGRHEDVSKYVVEELDGQEAIEKMGLWLDELGI